MSNTKRWKRIIAHVDFDAFFASIEQRDDETLRGQPIGIVNGTTGTTLITTSYEARRYGIVTGMHIKEAVKRCPTFQAIASRPHHYAEISSTIMAALHSITPDIEIFSVDEAFLDITHCKALHKTPKLLAEKIHALIHKTVNLTCSIGISGDKTTAKFAAKRNKPNGTCIIPPWQAEEALANEPVTALCGINKGTARFLAKHGIATCGQMKTLPISVLSGRFGNIGKRLWYMAQGNDPEPVLTDRADPKSMGCGKVIPPNTSDAAIVESYLYGLCDKLAFRLRQNKRAAKQISVGFKLQYYWLQEKMTLPVATQDDSVLFILAKALLSEWQGQGVYQINLTATEVCDNQFAQTDLFAAPNEKRQKVLQLRDEINARFGQGILKTATGVMSPVTTDVIAPSWQPNGARHSVQTTKEQQGGKPVTLKPVIGDIETALPVAERKWPKIKGKTLFERRGKLANFLGRKNINRDLAWKISKAFEETGFSETVFYD